MSGEDFRLVGNAEAVESLARYGRIVCQSDLLPMRTATNGSVMGRV